MLFWRAAIGSMVLAVAVMLPVRSSAQARTAQDQGPIDALRAKISTLEAASHQSLTVNCGAHQTVSAALDRAGQAGVVVITIKGTCHESVVVRRSNITLQGAAVGDGIVAPNGTVPVLTLVRSHNLVISQLSLSGGSQGLSLVGLSDVTVFNSAITNNAGQGILVSGPASVSLVDTTVTDNGFPGIAIGGGGHLRITRGAVANNRGPGVMLSGGTVGQILNNAQITGNGGPGVALSDSSLEVRQALIENNNGDGIVAILGSSISLNDAFIANNEGHGLALFDTSVARNSGPDSRILNNTRWGVACAPAPAVAQIIGSVGEVSGNDAGQVDCPSSANTGPF
jgi:hypothetical protein